MDRNKAISKLEGLIDEGKTNLQNAIVGIQDEWKNRRDIIVKPVAIDYDIDQSGVHPVVYDERFDITHHSYGQLLDRAQVPRHFADKLRDLEQYDLLRTNLKTLMPRVSNDGVLIRHIGPLAKAFFSSRYKRMDAGPIFESFLETAIQNDYVPYRGLNTDTIYAISMLDKNVYEPAPNEFVVYGIQITTSDYKPKALEFNLMMMRIVCSNLAVGMNVLRKIHLGTRFDQDGFNDTNVIELSQNTYQLDVKATASAISDGVIGSRRYISGLNGVIEGAINKDVDIEKVVVDLKKRGIRKEMTEKVKAMYKADVPIEALPEKPSAWRLSNVLSLLAKSEQGDNKVELEKLAFEAAA